LIPPGFVARRDADGLSPPVCYFCARSTNFEGRLICEAYEAWVLLNSSCASHKPRDHTGETRDRFVRGKEFATKFPSGLQDLRDWPERG
jgi:hypothetical protein